jgi:hypothetical protein
VYVQPWQLQLVTQRIAHATYNNSFQQQQQQHYT